MAYAMRNNSYFETPHYVLVEVSSKEAAFIEQADKGDRDVFLPGDDQFEYHLVSSERAHAWVRAGGTHETYLYTDNGRVRRAQDAA